MLFKEKAVTKFCSNRYVSIVHGGQAAVDAAILKLFPEWIDTLPASAQTAMECASVSDHAVVSSASADSSSVLSVHDDLDEYLLEMDKESVSGSGFSFVDGGNSHSDLVAKSKFVSTHRVSKDSASFVSATDAIETSAALLMEDSKSVLDKLSVSATRLRLLKRAPQVAALCELGEVPCSDLDAGKFLFNF